MTCCGPCGSDKLERVDSIVEERLTFVASAVRSGLPAPPAPWPRAKVSWEWLAYRVTEKYDKGAPLDRIRRILSRKGIDISLGAWVGRVAKAVKRIGPIDNVQGETLLAGSHMCTDGTGLVVLHIMGPGTHHGYLEASHQGPTEVFQYEASKEGKRQAKKLETFKGVLQADAESRYNETFNHPDIHEAGCHAHPRRALRDAEVQQPVLAQEAGRFIGEAFGAEAEARQKGLNGEALRIWRQEKVRPALERFRDWSRAVEPKLTPKDPLKGALRYYRNHWAARTRFLEDPAVAIDNSATERLFQVVGKLRHACLFAGSPAGAVRMARLLGIMATCRRLGVDPEGYLWAL